MGKYILFLGILLSVLIRIFFIVNGSDIADINKLHQIAQALLTGNNPYSLFNFTPYPPIGYYIETLILFISNISCIPFHITTKILPNFADIITTIVLYRFMIKQNTKPIIASLWSLIFVLNPISIIIFSAHGQLDSITSLLVLLAIYIFTSNPTKFNRFLPALLLGLAIAIKPNPVILLPFFLIYKKWGIKQNVIFLSICLAPAIISIAPYMLQSPHAVISNVFNYSGVYDFSYPAVLRAFWYQDNASIWLPFSQEWLHATKLAFFAGFALLLIIFAKSKQLVKACLVLYLLFIGVYFGISAQYLSWILPLAILTRDRMVIPFSIAGTIALFGFYLFFGPEILFGRFWHEPAFQNKYLLIYFVGNLLLWITILIWTIKIVKNQLLASFKTFSLFYIKVIIISLIIFVISLIPILRLIFNTLILITI